MSGTYIQFPTSAAQSVPTVPTAASLPVTGAYDGQLYLTTDTDSLYAWNLATVTWVLLNSSSTITGTGANGKAAVWTGASSLGVSSATGIASLSSGALSTTANGTANQVFGMNAAANGYEYKSILGTSNQVVVTHGTGTLTLSLPQSIDVGASPTFSGLTLSSFSTAGIVHNDASGVLSTSTLVNADVSASAAIAFSKLAALPSAQFLVGSGGNVATAVAASGDLTLANTGAFSIGAGKVTNAMLAGSIAASKLIGTDIATVGTVTAGTWNATLIGSLYGGTGSDSSASTGIAHVSSGTWTYSTIVNGDVSASAGIAFSKLAGLTSAHILVGNGSNVATDTAVTGDVTISNAGVTAIGTNKVANSQLAQMAANTIKGNNTGSIANAVDLTVTQTKALLNTAPTLQKFTSGSGTYTTPSGALYLKIKMVGGGGGGGGISTSTVNAGGTGGNTTFGSSLLVSNGGVGGAGGVRGGIGGTASLGSGPIGTALTGGTGYAAHPTQLSGGGASSPFGGAPGGVYISGAAQDGTDAISNTGSGGAGAISTVVGADGGGAGGYVDAIITSPSATYPYAVGAAGASGSGSTAGGGAGGSGYIVIEEYYQ